MLWSEIDIYIYNILHHLDTMILNLVVVVVLLGQVQLTYLFSGSY